MYRRQLISTLSLISLCLVLLGAGFFSLYYQYHLNEMKKLIGQDVNYISKYASLVLQNEEDIMSDDFLRYLGSVALISNTTVLLCNTEGSVVFTATPDDGGNPRRQ